MCGVCGVWAPNSGSEECVRITAAMRDLLSHRGPDDSNQIDWPEKGLSLGHTRLSIIDVSASSQPMTCCCTRFTLSFNGEIFNYIELRKDLDYSFQTAGDTETLLALLKLEGVNALNKVRGQFSFALWDNQSQKLMLAVDAMGVLPMYVSSNLDRVAFSSSARSIASALACSELDQTALKDLLNKRTVSAPHTPYKGIRRIGPGEIWTFTSETIERNRWSTVLEPDISDRVKKLQLNELLDQAAQRAVTSDVEIGVFLSGGLDSALVAALAKKKLSYRLKAYTAVWPVGDEFSESVAATRTAQILNLEHTFVEVTPRIWWDSLVLGTKHRDAPMGEPADPVFYALAQRASQDVKVVMTGEGADELFGCYPKYRAELLANFSIVRRFARFVGAQNFVTIPTKFKRLFSAIQIENPVDRWGQYFSTNWKFQGKESRKSMNLNGNVSGLNGLRIWDLEQWLPSALLDRADKMAMAHSLEVRPIFLDRDVVQFALSVNARRMISIFGTKRLLRRSARKILPRQLTHARKRGFPLPLSAWIRQELGPEFREVLSRQAEELDKYVTAQQRLDLLEEHLSCRGDNALKLFTLTSILLWMESLDDKRALDPCSSQQNVT